MAMTASEPSAHGSGAGPMGPGAGRPALGGPASGGKRRRSLRAFRLTLRYVLARTVSKILVRSMLRTSVEGRENLPEGPYLICFSHGSWADPFVLMAVLPWRPRLYFFGPKEEDMSRGGRNRLMRWAGNAVPYRPGKNDLLDATRRVKAVFDAGGVLAIAGEGRVHAHEGEVLPLNEGAAYFALRAGIPIVPLVIGGLSWFSIGSRVRVRLGRPIETSGRPTREVVEALTAETFTALTELSRNPGGPGGGRNPLRRPGPFGRWLTELFNEWPEGGRPD